MALQVKTTVTLSAQEEAFVMALARGIPSCRAAQAAGWSAAQGRYLLERQHVAAALRAICANVQSAVARCDKIALSAAAD
jgi:hypothetical protein